MQYDKNVLSIRDDVANFEVKQSIDVNVLFISQVLQYLTDGCLVLDVGTGNGFVLSQILQKSDKSIQLHGIDNSSKMVSLAKENLANSAEIIEASVDHLPFDDETFDIVTAKNVTRIDVAEIFRVLKNNGRFIFREYGLGKGMIEIAELFKGRIIRQRNPNFYVEKLLAVGFQVIKFDQFEIIRSYRSADELVSIVKSFPLVEEFSKSDEVIILKKFAKNATITSDPFILVAIKKKGCE